MQIWIYAILSVTLVSLFSLVGIFTLALNKGVLEKILRFMVSFAVGALFGDAFIHLIPEAYEELGIVPLVAFLVLAGLLLFLILEKVVRWRHCHIPTSVVHPHPVVFMNIIGDGMHNLIDGMIIGASYFVSVPIGITTTLAVILHEIPQEIGDFGILLHGGLNVKRALLVNFLSGVTAVIGAVIAMLAGVRVENFAVYVLPLTAGGFIYMAGSDLIPTLHQECEARISFMQVLCVLAGMAVMTLLLLID